VIDLTAKIAAAYLEKTPLAAADIPELIRTIYGALASAAAPAAQPAEQLQPSVSIKRSVTPDAIICLECGRPQKMMKRHLAAAHGLSVDEYRSKWSLPASYPMVAANYAEHRSQLAIKIGLGRKKPQDEQTEPAEAPAKPRHQYPASRWSRSKE
jgi:predicted transcriptional regulator